MKNDCRRIQAEIRLRIQPSFVPGPAAFPGNSEIDEARQVAVAARVAGRSVRKDFRI